MNNAKLITLLLLQEASDFRNLEDLTEFYMKHNSLLGNYTIVNATETSNSIDLYSVFSDIKNVKGQLYTPFLGGKVNIVNRKIISRGLKTGDGKVFVQGCISFDTQVISYFYRYYLEQLNSLPQNIQAILELLYEKKIGVDYIPYAMENLLFLNSETIIVRDAICAFERLYYKGKRSRLYCLHRANKVMRLYNKRSDDINKKMLKLYYVLYAMLLEICYTQLAHRTYSLERKMWCVCKFADENLSTMMYPELILAKRYFEQGQKCTFLGKIQKGRSDILTNIKNMAWDLFHLRMLEINCVIRTNRFANVNIPYFCTYDSRLLDVKNCYELKSIAINHKTGERIPFYSRVDEIMEYVKEYGMSGQIMNRMKQREKIVLKDVIADLERNIQSI